MELVRGLDLTVLMRATRRLGQMHDLVYTKSGSEPRNVTLVIATEANAVLAAEELYALALEMTAGMQDGEIELDYVAEADIKTLKAHEQLVAALDSNDRPAAVAAFEAVRQRWIAPLAGPVHAWLPTMARQTLVLGDFLAT